MNACSSFTTVRIRVLPLTDKEKLQNKKPNFAPLFSVGSNFSRASYTIREEDGVLEAVRTPENWLVIPSLNYFGRPLKNGSWSWEESWENACVEILVSSAEGWVDASDWSQVMRLEVTS